MLHKRVFEQFLQIMNVKEGNVKAWYPNGEKSIRIVMKDMLEYVFTYYSVYNWDLKTKGYHEK